MSYKYFTRDEFKCHETGENEINPDFIETLDQLREDCGFPFVISSGYRSPKHPLEAVKKTPEPTQGIAADIVVSGGAQRRVLVEKALELGFNGIGVAKTFVHVDIRTTTPVIWTY